MSTEDAIRIVLVGTQHPGNIGSAARAMKTMGLSNLVLVAPKRYPDPEAVALAAGADDILELNHGPQYRVPPRFQREPASETDPGYKFPYWRSDARS